MKAANTRRLWKPAGLKVIFALLNNPDMVNWTYRQIAAATGTLLGTVEWIFRDLIGTGFLLDMGRRRRLLTDMATLMKRWVEVYPEQLRLKLVIERLAADEPVGGERLRSGNMEAAGGGGGRCQTDQAAETGNSEHLCRTGPRAADHPK